jgi:hypothetical protein
MAELAVEASRDDGGGREGEVAAVGGEGGDEPARVGFGVWDAVQPQHGLRAYAATPDSELGGAECPRGRS